VIVIFGRIFEKWKCCKISPGMAVGRSGHRIHL
jgi:hypothetical protein